MSRAGLGFLNMLKTESQQVVVGTGAVSVAGSLVYFAYLASSARKRSPRPCRWPCCLMQLVDTCAHPSAVADKLPGTFKKEWIVATAKYRAAMDQDPISQGRGS